MNNPAFYWQATSNISSTTSPHINVGDVQQYKLCSPPTAEQKEIGMVLASNERNLELEQARMSKLQATKIGLMHDLLTGKVRVNNLLTHSMETK